MWDAEANFIALPPPSAKDVEGVLRRAVRQLGKDFADRAVEFPDDGLEAMWSTPRPRGGDPPAAALIHRRGDLVTARRSPTGR